MARIRTIKPEFFRHEGLYEAEKATKFPLRVAFAGLWTCCDRAGRFRWQPNVLKLDVLPFDQVDFSRVLDALVTRGFVVKYASHGKEYGHIPSWDLHQVINNRETESNLPEPPQVTENEDTSTREARVNDALFTRHGLAQGEGKGREGEEEGKGKVYSAEPLRAPAPAMTFSVVGPGGPKFGISAEFVAECSKTYPGLDVMAEFAKAALWLKNNPAKRKTARGIPKFLGGWLERAQNGNGQRLNGHAKPAYDPGAIPTSEPADIETERAKAERMIRTLCETAERDVTLETETIERIEHAETLQQVKQLAANWTAQARPWLQAAGVWRD